MSTLTLGESSALIKNVIKLIVNILKSIKIRRKKGRA